MPTVGVRPIEHLEVYEGRTIVYKAQFRARVGGEGSNTYVYAI